MRAKLHIFPLLLLVMLAGLLTLLLFARPLWGNALGTIPLPVNIPVPATVYHSDAYGDSMAMDGDFLVVGAPFSKVDGSNPQGMIYLFTRNADNPTNFTLTKSITSSISGDRNHFGVAVDIHAETLAVGSWRDDGTASAVYLYERNQGGENNWGEVKKLVREDGQTTTGFGRALALHDDTLVIGAKDGHSQLGEALIYQRDQNGANQWGKTQTLIASVPITSAFHNIEFGESIAFDGTRLVISAPNANVTAQDLPSGSPTPPLNFSGAVFVFHQEGGQWLQEAKLLSGDIDLATNYYGKEYGTTLALNGDLLFVGEPGGKTNGVAAGKVYVYQRGAGSPSPYGQPGAWGEIGELTPADGVANDRFGQALYAVDDGLLVSAEKLGVGKVYFFRNLAIVTGSRVEPQSALAWSHIYSFTTSSDGTSSGFGLPLTGSGNSVLIGDSEANNGRGGVMAYRKDALFAVDPASTPTPTATPLPTATPPLNPASCLSTSRIYLPIVANNATGAAAVAGFNQPLSAPIVQETAPIVGNLAPGCLLDGPGGMKVGAMEGAISETLTISLAVTAAPTTSLPTGATVRGDYLRVTANRNQLAVADQPFVIAMPVPSGVDPAHLVLLHTFAGESLLDANLTGEQWGYLPGVYDAGRNLFLARLLYLADEGTTFVLANHADFDTPPNPTQPISTTQAAAIDQPASQYFDAWCLTETFANPTQCGEQQENLVETMLDEIYRRMTEVFHYPTTLRLLDTTGRFIVSESVLYQRLNANYAVHIISSTDAQCRDALGFYSPESGLMALCWKTGEPIDNDEMEILIHEFFHAVEFTHPNVMRHRQAGIQQDWIIEGMAEAAKKSYFESTMQRSPFYGVNNLQNVDRLLTVGKAGDSNIEEYLAQDFWVYVGASEGVGLEYLNEILRIGGAHQDDIDVALNFVYDKSLSEFYWGWVKHQTIENLYDVGAGSGQLCQLNAAALFANRPVFFPSGKQYFPFDSQEAYDILPPLTAKVIEIQFENTNTPVVLSEYQGCAGLQDSIAYAACRAVAKSQLKVKIYVQDESNCWNDPLPGVTEEGSRYFENLSLVKRYFVVVANVDPENEHGYFIGLSD